MATVTVRSDSLLNMENESNTKIEPHLHDIPELSILKKLTTNTELSADGLPTYFNGSCYGTGQYAHPLLCHQYFVCHEGNLVSGKLTIQRTRIKLRVSLPTII